MHVRNSLSNRLLCILSHCGTTVPHGLCAVGFFPSPSLFLTCSVPSLFVYQRGYMCLSALAKNQYYHKGQHRKLSYTSAHYLRPLGRTLYHLLAPWHRTPAGKLLQLFEQTQKGAFFPINLLGILGFCTASAMPSLHALKPCTGSWTFLLADLKSCFSLLPSSANTADSLKEQG